LQQPDCCHQIIPLNSIQHVSTAKLQLLLLLQPGQLQVVGLHLLSLLLRQRRLPKLSPCSQHIMCRVVTASSSSSSSSGGDGGYGSRAGACSACRDHSCCWCF
jgi:hypothetical protein